LYHTQKVALRSHATREEMHINMDGTFKDVWLNDGLRKDLEAYHKKFCSGKEVSSEVLGEYEVLIKGVLEKLVGN